MWLDNLVSYSLQIAVLILAGTAFLYLFRMKAPAVLLAFWQALLVGCLLLPACQPWRQIPQATRGGTVRIAVDANPPAAILSSGSSAQAIAPLPKPVLPFSTPRSAALILAAGAGLRLMWLVTGLFRLRRYRNRARRLSSLPDAIRDMQWRVGVVPDIFLSADIDSPVTFGWRNPSVLFPASFADMRESMRRPVVCHELLHVQRRDWLFIVIEEILRSLFWFHPAIWWALARIHLSREQVVDREVLRVTGARGPYLESLLHIASLRGRPAAVPAPLLLKERHLVQRVALMLKESKMTRTRIVVSLAVIAGFLLLTGEFAAARFPLVGPPEPVPAPMAKHTEVKSAPSQSDQIQMNYDNAPIADFIAQVARVLGMPPIEVDPAVKGAVSFRSASPMSRQQVLDLLYSVLRQNNAMLAKSGNSYRVVPVPGAIQRAQREPLHVEASVQERKLLTRVEPVYPELARKARVESMVTVEVLIDEAGSVANVRVLRGHPLLDLAVIDAVMQWRYYPTYAEGGVAVPVITTLDIPMPPVHAPNIVAVVPGAVSGMRGGTIPPAAQAPRTEPQYVGGNVQESKLLRRVEPVYPELAREAGIAMTVYLEVTVNEHGEVTNVRVIRGHRLLDQAAIDAVKQWLYAPTYLNGQAIPVVTTVALSFGPASDPNRLVIDGDGLLRDLEGQIVPVDIVRQRNEPLTLSPGPQAPFEVIETALKSLENQGIRFKFVSGAYRYALGRLFYYVPGGRTPGDYSAAAADPSIEPPVLDVDPQRLAALAQASGMLPPQLIPYKGGTSYLSYMLYISEAGTILSVSAGDLWSGISEVMATLRSARVLSQGRRGNQPVPVALKLLIELKNQQL